MPFLKIIFVDFDQFCRGVHTANSNIQNYPNKSDRYSNANSVLEEKMYDLARDEEGTGVSSLKMKTRLYLSSESKTKSKSFAI